MLEQHHNFLPPTILVLATILFVSGMKYMSTGRQWRKQFASDNAFQLLAEKTTEAQSIIALSLTTAQAELADVRVRLSAIEKMLRDVG